MKDAAEVFDCPHCATGVKIPMKLFGKNVRCPKCKKAFTAGSVDDLDVLEEVEAEDYEVGNAPSVRMRRYRDVHDDDEDEDDRPRKRRRRPPSRSNTPQIPFSQRVDTSKLTMGVIGIVCGMMIMC